MTAPQLLALILTAVLLQAAVAGGVFVWRRRGSMATPPVADPGDIAIGQGGAWSGWRGFRVLRRACEDAAQTQCSFYLQPLDAAPLAPYLPGQYLTLRLEVADVDATGATQARQITRCYSLSDLPDPWVWRITVKRALPPHNGAGLPPGLASGHLHDQVHEGDVLQLRAPAGKFHIDPDPSVPAVFIAGGIGITPMMSMLRWCLAELPQRRLHLYYGVRSSADQAFKPVLQALAAAHPNFRLNVVYSAPEPADILGQDHQHVGYIDMALLRRSLPHGRHQFYVCGPPAMMQALVPGLRDWGVQPQDIHFEAFGPATVWPLGVVRSESGLATAESPEVQFRRSGRTLVWDGQSSNLLDFAERHQVLVDSGCRSGSCGACETRLLSGSVHYPNPPDHEVRPGHCLLCVGKPQSALVLDA